MRTSWRLGPAAVAIAAAAVLVGCASAPSPGSGSTPGAVVSSSPAAEPSPGTSTSGAAARQINAAELARCAAVLEVPTVRGLLGGTPEVTGGKERVTGAITQTRCTWTAASGRYLTIVSLDGPGLPERARTVAAGAKPVPGRTDVLYDASKGLIVTVDDRLHQVVAGGAGTAQARIIGLKAIDAIRSGG
ncbi:hypothetical protein [Longivirga aurantiaca]|uniref:DUF3558 domain-containing protein n=1 Tax=Longivirga aurantiaca TaxID=1837743 RepID=A0ABW1T3A3_9ACTN